MSDATECILGCGEALREGKSVIMAGVNCYQMLEAFEFNLY